MRRHNRKRVAAVAAALALAAALAAGCGTSGGKVQTTSSGLKSITYSLGFSPNYDQYYFFTALEKGFYKDAGLDVHFIIPGSTTTAAKLVSIGKAQLGETLGTDPIAAVDNGLGVRVVATVQRLALGLMYLPEKVKSFQDLRGQKVAVFQGAYDDVCRGRLLQKNGMTDKDIQTVDAGFDSVSPLLSGSVAAAEGGETAEKVNATLKRNGKPVGFFTYDDVCPSFPLEIVANTTTIKTDPDAVRKFVAASARGAAYAMDHPDEARAIFDKRYPEAAAPPIRWQRAIPTWCAPAGVDMFANDPAEWQKEIELMVQARAVQHTPRLADVIASGFTPSPAPQPKACGAGQ